MTVSAVFTQRLERLADILREAGLDALFCSSPVTMGYLHGFHESGHERFLTLGVDRNGRRCLICPGLTATQARRCGLEDVRPWNDGEDPLALLGQLAREWGLESGALAVDDDMPAAQLLAMQRTLPGAAFRPGQPVLSQLMRAKGQDELDLLLQAGRIADQALPVVLGQIRPGMTEREVSACLADAMRRLGGAPTFCIAAAGANGAEPHHETDDTRLQEGDLLIMDYGCCLGGYMSDTTRTVSVGKAKPEAREVYGIVLRAHQAARAAIRPGLPCQEVDRAARKVIAEAGYGAAFMHRTGHGIGLRTHEEPYMVEGNRELLVPGNCFSVEPGIYLPGRFGVRIENCVACTGDGHLSFNAEPAPELVEVG